MPLSGWKMPNIWPGATVLWTDDPGNDPDKHYAAIVTAVYDEMIDVCLFVPGAISVDAKIGVRYVDDPNTTAMLNAEMGCWLFTKGHGLQGTIQANVSMVEASMASAEKPPADEPPIDPQPDTK